MKENEFRPIALNILEQLGLRARCVQPIQGILTPDFEAIGQNDKYTIELKIKDDDQQEILQDRNALLHGKLVSKSIPIAPRNTLSGIINKAVSQLTQHDPQGNSFRLIWFHAAGSYPELHYDRLHATLFGTEHLFSLRLPGNIICYYFYDSSFFKHRNFLDGAIVTWKDDLQLCINSLSHRADQFR